MATVLVVEDNQDIASLYQNIFTQHHVHVSGDIPEAINFLQHECPDLIITDFYLPSGSAADIVTHLRGNPKLNTVPILGVSVDDLKRQEASELGLNAFLAKPLDFGELMNVTQRLLTLRREPPALEISTELRRALLDYVEAFRRVHNMNPDEKWLRSQVADGGRNCDIHLLRAETKRLRTSAEPKSKNYLTRLIDKLRRM